MLLGIDGRSGVGKTRLAAAVAEQLGTRGRRAIVLSMDDLYAGWHGLSGVGATLCRDVVAPIRQGRRPRVRRYDWTQGAFGRPATLLVEDVLILEGVGSTVHRCRGALDLTVWVQASRTTRLARAEHRAGQGDFAGHAAIWERQELALFGPDRYPEAQQGFDLVVDTTDADTVRDARIEDE